MTPPEVSVWQDDDFLGDLDNSFGRLTDSLRTVLEALAGTAGDRPGILGARPDLSYLAEEDVSPLSTHGLPRDVALLRASEAFGGVLLLHSRDMLFNASPPPSTDAAALVAATAAYDPNGLWDEMSGGFALAELRVLRYLGGLVGWPAEEIAGAFTYGGKGTLAYALVQGMREAWPDFDEHGAGGASRVLVSQRVHFSFESVCVLHGLGTSNCVRIAEKCGRLDVADFRRVLHQTLGDGIRVPAVVLTGGAIIDCIPDPIAEVSGLIDEAVDLFGLDYRPTIHIDAVVTWPWLALHAADPGALEAGAGSPAARRSAELAAMLAEVSYADSFGVDFHKLGHAPNVSSCFVTRRPDRYYADKPGARPARTHGSFRPYLNTFENTRPCTGIASAYYLLLRLGTDGLARHAIGLAENREVLAAAARSRSDFATIVNEASLGVDVVLRPYLGMSAGTVGDLGTAGEPDRVEWARRCDTFYRWLLRGDGSRAPVIGYVTTYTDGLPALLLVSTVPGLQPEVADDLIGRLADAVSTWVGSGDAEPVPDDLERAGERPTPPR